MDNLKLLDALRMGAKMDAEKDVIRGILVKGGWSESAIEEYLGEVSDPDIDVMRDIILEHMTTKGEA